MGIEKFINVSVADEYFDSPYGSPSQLDKRLWLPPFGESRVRLLPQPVENSLPYLHIRRHSYNYNKFSLWAMCPTTVGDKCPVCDVAWRFYKATPEVYGSKAEYLRELGANLRPISRYYFNIYVVSDPKNPENNGAVKVLSVGLKLFKIIQQGWKDMKMAIFDPENGYDLIIRKGQSGQFPDYTTSSFAREKTFVAKWEDLMPQAYNLEDFLNIPSREELIEMFSIIPEVAEEFNKLNQPSTTLPKVTMSVSTPQTATGPVPEPSTEAGTYIPPQPTIDITKEEIEPETGSENLDELDIDAILRDLEK